MCDTAFSCARYHLLPLLNEAAEMIRGVPKEIADFKNELKRIEDFINHVDRLADDEEDKKTSDAIKARMKQLIEASFHIEDVIDDYIFHEEQQSPDPGCAAGADLVKTMILRLKIAYKIHLFNSHKQKRLINLPILTEIEYSSPTNRNAALLQNLRDAPLYMDKDDVVGFEEPRDKLIDWLIEGRPENTVVSIVGMRGLGKTTLAKKVFDNLKVVKQFDLFLWITVSQLYHIEKVLSDMLLEICEQQGKDPPESLRQMDRKALVDEVRNYLQGKRYVVVFDDVRESYFWYDIQFALFDNKNGSRILITTTNMDAVGQCKKTSKVHEMQPLTLEKSWELFNKKAFHDLEGNCPENLKDICLEIVKKCKGLPLTIMAIGGVLFFKYRNSPERYSENTYAEMIHSEELSPITRFISSDYDDLPSFLKPCLLYFAIYPEDYEIKPKRLIRHWIAEGFVKEEHGKTLEEVAERYLKELINRSLVQKSSVSIDGKAVGIRIHDLYLLRLREKASDLCFCEFVTEHHRSLCGIIRRLSIAITSNDLIEHIESSHVRSLLFFLEEEIPENLVRKIPAKCKLIKVLDFENSKSLVVPENIGDLIHLKYLSFRNTELKYLPKSIGKLQNLETLDLRQTAVHEIPKEISKCRKLRHLLGNTMSLSQLKGGLGGMKSLQTLSEVKIDEDGIELITELGKLRELRKLSLSDVREEHGTALCSSINQMHYMEKLYIKTKSKDVPIDLSSLSHTCIPMLHKLHLRAKLNNLPRWIPKLMKLVELSLSYSWLTEDPLESLKDLPNLLVFNLAVDSYNGKLLHFQCRGFRKLQQLGIRYLSNLESISIENGALPAIKELTFMNIPKLKSVPSGIYYLQNLDVLNTHFMPTEFKKIIAPFAKLIDEKNLENEKRRYLSLKF